MSTYRVTVTQEVIVQIPDRLMTEAWLADFRESFYPFKTEREHAEHLGQLEARGLIPFGGFVEGYGTLADVKIQVSATETVDVEAYVIRKAAGK